MTTILNYWFCKSFKHLLERKLGKLMLSIGFQSDDAGKSAPRTFMLLTALSHFPFNFHQSDWLQRIHRTPRTPRILRTLRTLHNFNIHTLSMVIALHSPEISVNFEFNNLNFNSSLYTFCQYLHKLLLLEEIAQRIFQLTNQQKSPENSSGNVWRIVFRNIPQFKSILERLSERLSETG